MSTRRLPGSPVPWFSGSAVLWFQRAGPLLDAVFGVVILDRDMPTQTRDAAIVGCYEYPLRKVEGLSSLQIKAECAIRALEPQNHGTTEPRRRRVLMRPEAR